MQRIRIQVQKESLKREKQTKYKDSTRIKLEHFNFSKNEFDVLDRFNVKNLILIFKKKNCFQQDNRHHVTIIINREQLNFVIHFINIFFTVLFDNTQIEQSELQFLSKFRLECFHDRCRV